MFLSVTKACFFVEALLIALFEITVGVIASFLNLAGAIVSLFCMICIRSMLSRFAFSSFFTSSSFWI